MTAVNTQAYLCVPVVHRNEETECFKGTLFLQENKIIFCLIITIIKHSFASTQNTLD